MRSQTVTVRGSSLVATSYQAEDGSRWWRISDPRGLLECFVRGSAKEARDMIREAERTWALASGNAYQVKGPEL